MWISVQVETFKWRFQIPNYYCKLEPNDKLSKNDF